MKQPTLRASLLLASIGWILVVSAQAEDRKTDAPHEKTLRSFHGEITSIERVAKAITVRKFPVSKRFLVAVTCKITTTDKPDASLQDLKVGDKVKVRYDEEKDGLIARQIIIRGIDAEDREDAREKEKLDRQ